MPAGRGVSIIECSSDSMLLYRRREDDALDIVAYKISCRAALEH